MSTNHDNREWRCKIIMIKDWKLRAGGLIQSPVDPRDYIFKTTKIELPKTYNENIVGHIHNQGVYNNCAAHALSSFIEIILNSKNQFKEISFPWYYGNRNYTEHKDQGLISRDLLKTAQKDGGLYLFDYPKVEEMKQAMYTFNASFPKLKSKAQNIRIGNYYQCTTVDQVKEAIYKYGSCMLGTYLFESFGEVAEGRTLYMNEPIVKSEGGGVMSIENPVGGHMMLAVGWVEDYFIVQNSWGEEFGKNGYFYMPFSLSTWNVRYNFPIPVFEAWAIDGIYLDGKFTSFSGSEIIPEPENPTEPTEKDNWYQRDGKWRYKKDGKDVTNAWMKISGVWYSFDSNGYMRANQWVKDGDKWRYVTNSGGAVCNNWYKIENRWYWFDEDAHSIKGWKNINGVDYYFAEKYFGKIKECECMVSCK